MYLLWRLSPLGSTISGGQFCRKLFVSYRGCSGAVGGRGRDGRNTNILSRLEAWFNGHAWVKDLVQNMNLKEIPAPKNSSMKMPWLPPFWARKEDTWESREVVVWARGQASKPPLCTLWQYSSWILAILLESALSLQEWLPSLLKQCSN